VNATTRSGPGRRSGRRARSRRRACSTPPPARLRVDARGFESQFATNHLGHFQLTARLWPGLVAARGARVVTLCSRGHVRGAVDLEDPMFVRRPYDKWVAYGQSEPSTKSP
jgi:NAD(P)-dependent dehydrogenase (short-subunit alcohol dehydrogenase family)